MSELVAGLVIADHLITLVMKYQQACEAVRQAKTDAARRQAIKEMDDSLAALNEHHRQTVEQYKANQEQAGDPGSSHRGIPDEGQQP